MTDYTSRELFIVPEKQLIELLYAYNKLQALENGGVDNWIWYGGSLRDFLRDFVTEHPQLVDEDEDDVTFDFIAEYDLVDYQTLDELITGTKWEIED